MTENNLWSLVERYPYNPHCWTELVSVAEKSCNYEGIVKAYKEFLKIYPLMHVYWNKYAILVYNKTKSPKEAKKIFEQAVTSGVLEHSVDMWQYYCEFVTKYSVDFEDEEIKSIYERAIRAIGNDYTSDTIWSMYINWEENHHHYDIVSSLFSQVLTQPIRNLQQYWSSFEQHAQNHSIEKAATGIERSQIDDQLNLEAENDVSITAAELASRLNQRIYERKAQVYQETLQNISLRMFFESKIHRSYFHFAPLDPVQLANWHEYLDFEEKSSDVSKIIHLYERALIPCALCPDVWIKYASFLSKSSMNYSDLFARLSCKAVSQNPEFIRLQILLEESMNNLEKAKSLAENLALFNSADAEIPLAFYKLREANEQGELEQAKTQVVDRLNHFLQNCRDPSQIAAVSAVIYRISKTADIDLLEMKCSSSPLALSIIVNSFIDSKLPERAYETFLQFLVPKSNKESAPLKGADRVQGFRVFLDFLRKNNYPIEEIRNAQFAMLDAENEIREKILKDRYETTKETQNISEILDRWILYLQETNMLPHTTE